MKITLSTRNPSKVEQIKAMFEGMTISVLTLSEVGIEGEAIEDGATLEENALKKAQFAYQPGTWAMADDTGLFIDYLNGKPGIHAARWAGETATTAEIMEHTLKQLEGATNRVATFKTVVALISPTGEQKFFTGEVLGKILTAPRVKPQPKMPYSPIFIPEGSDKVWAEMTTTEENLISHRGKAFRLLREHLSEQLK
jgi:XTP/dITP diphosphohydrolase